MDMCYVPVWICSLQCYEYRFRSRFGLSNKKKYFNVGQFRCTVSGRFEFQIYVSLVQILWNFYVI